MNEALRDLFLKSKFTQEKFAKVLGISRNRLCNVLYNKQKLKYMTFMKYQEKYDAYNLSRKTPMPLVSWDVRHIL